MTWYQTLNEVLDLRSFSNLWFWIALAVMWSGASHWVLGVPYDMVVRAARKGGEAQADLEDMARININRLLYITEVSGLWLLGFACFLLTSLLLLGFVYNLQIAQALFCLGFPMSIVWLLRIRSAHRIRTEQASGSLLRKYLTRQRIWTQVIGMISIFVTSMWGIYSSLADRFDQDHFKPLGYNIFHDEEQTVHHRGGRA
ncbi:component of SufBCD complex [Thalassovita aquimarina]|uniref:component of SufBCD complex n=1 Tax=Thalassovita aquimarina TaxID=2785917 RepID=UPI001FEB92F8|nr:component of SufBCD complex [Thalassovita aquimarina]